MLIIQMKLISHKFLKNIKLLPSARKMSDFTLSLDIFWIILFSGKYGKQLKIYWSVSKEEQEPCSSTINIGIVTIRKTS